MLSLQILFWLWLLLPSFSSIAVNPYAGMAAWMVFAAIAAFASTRQQGEEKKLSYLFSGVFAVSSLAWIWGASVGSLVTALCVSLASFGALFAYLTWKKPHMEAHVMGYDNGYAIVSVKPSLAAWVQPGVYAVSSGKVKKGQKVKVRFEPFSRKGRVE